MLFCRLLFSIFIFTPSLFAAFPNEDAICQDSLFSVKNSWLPSGDSNLDLHLSNGLTLFRAGKFMRGKNELYKWLVLKEKLKNTEFDNVRVKVKDCLERISKAQSSVRIEPEIRNEPIPERRVEKEKKVRIFRDKPKHQLLRSRTISPQSLILKAEKFRKSGQLEESLRFFQLAQKMDPSDVSVIKAIGELKNEIGF